MIRRTLYCRGDWTPVKLFLRGAASIEPHVRRLIVVCPERHTPTLERMFAEWPRRIIAPGGNEEAGTINAAV